MVPLPWLGLCAAGRARRGTGPLGAPLQGGRTPARRGGPDLRRAPSAVPDSLGVGAERARPISLRRSSRGRYGTRAPEERPAVIDLYYWTTPNGHKITISSRRPGSPYRIVPVNIGKGEQFEPDVPARSRPTTASRRSSTTSRRTAARRISVFESGAILHLPRRQDRPFLPADLRGRSRSCSGCSGRWAGSGPMAGQNHHFIHYAPEKIPYAIDRYVRRRRGSTACSTSASRTATSSPATYSIADMACYPWIVPHERQGQNLDDFPNLKRWLAAIPRGPRWSARTRWRRGRPSTRGRPTPRRRRSSRATARTVRTGRRRPTRK